MLRLTIALLFAMAAVEPAVSADRALAHHRWHRVAIGLPAGLPRPHYNFRTTLSYGAPYPDRPSYGPRLSVYETPELLYAPVDVGVPYIRPWIGAPLLPGSAMNPGYIGSGEPYVGDWDRLPYACGVFGYC
jgi:hypothetical protein